MLSKTFFNSGGTWLKSGLISVSPSGRMPSFLAAGTVDAAGGVAGLLHAAAANSAHRVITARRIRPPMKESAFYDALALDAIHACRCCHDPDRDRSGHGTLLCRRRARHAAGP